jgi:acylphosphatase
VTGVLFSSLDMEAARRFIVSGLVQGVGFRYWALKRARERDLVGYVKNLHDGRVEIVAEGSAESLDAMRDDLRVGSGFSKVGHVEESRLEPSNHYTTFTIER